MTPEKTSAWNTEVGLPNDFDGYISNPRFGYTEAYASKVTAAPGGSESTGLQFIVDLISAQGEVLANAGWSVGGGWAPSADGRYITHPTRKNVVTGSMYANLQNRVIGAKPAGLEVDMDQRGSPLDAMSWSGLGFHWMVEEHKTVGGAMKPGLMPTAVLTGTAPAAAAASAKTDVSAEIIDRLQKMVKTMSIKQFQSVAVRIPEVSKNEALTNQVLDDGPNGFYNKNKA